MGSRKPVITIDGPAAAGKSTVARRLAERLGYKLVPTGTMYRAAALSVTRAGLPLRETPALRRHLARLEIEVKGGRVYLDREDVTGAIQSQEIARATSDMTTLSAVREKVTPLQRREAAGGGAVLEGRDTGTVVCPDAEVKFYLTASLEARPAAARRARGPGRPGVLGPGAAGGPRAGRAGRNAGALAPQAGPRRDRAGHVGPDGGRGGGAHAGGHRDTMLYAVLKALVAGLGRLLFRLEARNPGHVPGVGPALLVSNHSSVLDPPLIGSVASRQLSFLAKAELFRIPVFGALLRRLGARPLRREGSDPAAMRTALRVLEEGGALLVFPEGTRGPEGVLRPGRAGAGMLAVVSGAPVVPVYVSGSGRAWPRGARFPRPAKVTVAFGKPLRFDAKPGGGRREQYEAASRAMMAAIAQVKAARSGQELHAQIQ